MPAISADVAPGSQALPLMFGYMTTKGEQLQTMQLQ
jgi:hypothetical protein